LRGGKRRVPTFTENCKKPKKRKKKANLEEAVCPEVILQP
jgi:hypothetical protein